MRQFVAEIAEAMQCGMTESDAQQRMTARGVPLHVQWRIVDHR